MKIETKDGRKGKEDYCTIKGEKPGRTNEKTEKEEKERRRRNEGRE